MIPLKLIASVASLLFLAVVPTALGQKPPLTLDEFFNAVDIRSVQLSPDGHAVVVETRRPDWTANRFRNDLWLYRDDNGDSLVQLSQSGHDSSPQWSPDGRWIAFLSDPKRVATAPPKVSDGTGADKADKDVAQVYVIPSHGGEAVPVTFSEEEIHAFAWNEDSRRIYFATRNPCSKGEKDAYAEEWKDVVRFRELERGDALFGVDVAFLSTKSQIHPKQLAETPVPEKLVTTPYRVQQMVTSPDGHFLAIATDSLSGQLETHEPYGIYVADLPTGSLHLASILRRAWTKSTGHRTAATSSLLTKEVRLRGPTRTARQGSIGLTWQVAEQSVGLRALPERSLQPNRQGPSPFCRTALPSLPEGWVPRCSFTPSRPRTPSL